VRSFGALLQQPKLFYYACWLSATAYTIYLDTFNFDVILTVRRR